ncbi:hypothetical protein CcaCcLH18_13119 [Colletotrichum camelliae]|nr:hypothetical protein CcaCcLH18_13119 [Colletotrichum camelliae]
MNDPKPHKASHPQPPLDDVVQVMKQGTTQNPLTPTITNPSALHQSDLSKTSKEEEPPIPQPAKSYWISDDIPRQYLSGTCGLPNTYPHNPQFRQTQASTSRIPDIRNQPPYLNGPQSSHPRHRRIQQQTSRVRKRTEPPLPCCTSRELPFFVSLPTPSKSKERRRSV